MQVFRLLGVQFSMCFLLMYLYIIFINFVFVFFFIPFSSTFSWENWLVWMGMWTIFGFSFLGRFGDSTFSIGSKWICMIDLTSLSMDLQVKKNCNQSCGTLIFILKLGHSNSQHYRKEFSRMSLIMWACN